MLSFIQERRIIMEQGEIVRNLRKATTLTLEEFGKRLGVTKVAISNIENGKRNLTNQMIKAICREFNVEESYLITGKGNMFRELPKEDETAAIVSDLLEDGKENPFYEIILEIMSTYQELSPKSQEVLRDASAKLLENLRKKKGD